MKTDSHLWSIILAGGDGDRTKDFVRSALGHDKPNQFCTYLGSRSLVQHTIDRADALTPRRRRMVAARRAHRAELTAQLSGREGGMVLYQPSNRGTAAGVFLPLAQVLSRDAEAMVVIYPSDHFVYPEQSFQRAIGRAVSLCARAPDGVLVVGARPDRPETDYGWILPGAPVVGTHAKLRRVEGFVDRPTRTAAENTARAGGLCNTCIVIARARRLWNLGVCYLPDTVPALAPIAGKREYPHAPNLLERIYERLPVRDLSRDLLQPAARSLVVMETDGFFWSDWGRPARILDAVERLKRPAGRRSGLSARGTQASKHQEATQSVTRM